MQPNALDNSRFEQDLPKLLRAVERLQRSLEEIRRQIQARLKPDAWSIWTALIADKLSLVKSWRDALIRSIQDGKYQTWELRHALGDMRAVSRVMDLDAGWSTEETNFSAARTAVFELAKPLDNALRP